MARLRIEARTSERLDMAREAVWEKISQIPEAFAYFPLINEVTELRPGERYELQLGPFGYKSFSMRVDCQVDVATKPSEEVGFTSVPGTGNADVEAIITLDADEESSTLDVRLVVTPRVPIPRFVPKGVLEKSASATLRAGLDRGIRDFRRALEAPP